MDRGVDRLLTVSTGPLLLLTPFLVFVCHNGYALSRPEMLACLGGLGAIGVLLGALMAVGGPPLQIPITAALVTLFADVQTDWFTAWDWPLAGTFFAALLGAWLLRRQLSGVLTVALASMVLVTLLAGDGGRDAPRPGAPARVRRPDLPPLVHIVLDEQIGIEGIPREFDPDGRAAAALRTFYTDRGFQVFGKAYSRYFGTNTSLSHTLNFANTGNPFEFLRRGHSKPWVLHRSRYFEAMARRGYVLRIYQTDYMDFCDVSPSVPVASCDTYELERLASFEEAPLATGEKMKLIGGMYVRLSFLLTQARRAYGSTRATRPWARWLPAWEGMGRVSSVSVPPVLERIGRDVAQEAGGTMFFAHLMLPHYPYAYDTNCNLRPSVREWRRAFPGDNAAARAQHYPPYLAQVACVHRMLDAFFERMRAAELFDEAIVVVHGDHGSRLFVAQPQAAAGKGFRPTDYIDAFSTLFAIKLPGQPARYDDRLLPLDGLLKSFATWDRIAAGTAWGGRPVVNIRSRQRPVQRMPDFARGAPR